MDVAPTAPLLATFLEEVDEHVRVLNRELLALERGAAPDPERVSVLLRAAHSLKGAARVVDAAAIAETCHELEDILVAARDGGRGLDGGAFPELFGIIDRIAAEAVRLRVGHGGAAKAAAAAAHADGGSPRAPAVGGGGVVRVGAARLDALLADSGELLVGWRRLEARAAALATMHEQVARWGREWRGLERMLRKLPGGENGDHLPRRAAEILADTRNRIGHVERELDQIRAGLAADGHAIGQVAARLDDDVRRVRMLPFSDACVGLVRTVRDLAHAARKDAMLSVDGGAVEIDRSILEGMRDPLVQLVRNAIDHGIETPAERRAAGKPAEGRITVSAALRQGRVEVVVADDGRGIDRAALETQARAKHLQAWSDRGDAAYLAFEPGLSTAATVTDVSGRGVGLDVVRSRILEIGGTIDLASTPGQGTRFTLSLPLTLTTMRALFVAVGGETFAVGSTHVDGIVRVPRTGGPRVQGRDVLVRHDEIVPVVALTDVLALAAAEPMDRGDTQPAVIVSAGALRVALLVDEIVAEHEVLVKTLGSRLQGLPWISGATLLSSGRVALMLNAAEIVAGASACRASRAPQAAAALTPVAKRILVVDDSLTTRSLERSILEAAGYEVALAADGEAALRILTEGGADLVVCDVEMPRLDGFGFTEAVRASPRWRVLPIVLVTGRESPADRTRGLEVGADAYLVKSTFDQRVLLETVGQLL